MRCGTRPRTLTPSTESASNLGVKVADGSYPLWTKGDELVYLEGEALMTLPMQAQSPYRAGDPVQIAKGPYFRAIWGARPYDYDSVNDRFLVVRHRTTPRSLVLVQGLQEEIERLFAK